MSLVSDSAGGAHAPLGTPGAPAPGFVPRLHELRELPGPFARRGEPVDREVLRATAAPLADRPQDDAERDADG